jgi:serine/threonine-protein kinase
VKDLAAALSDRYRVDRALGEGGMATVYLATDIRHERQVAIKVMRPELAESLGGERFLREIRIAAQLAHPHIVGLLDSGQVGEGREALLYYVMPYMAGETLRARLAREGPLSIRTTTRFLTQLADALVKAHAQGFVHRDIKPDNIFITDNHVALADFGIARALSAGKTGVTPPGGTMATALGVSVGTPAYMAPEQAAADPSTDHRADIYSLGVVGYEMLAGKPPFEGTGPHQLVVAHLTQAPEPIEVRRPDVPPVLASIVMRCLSKDPAQRFQDATALRDALESVPLSDTSATATYVVPGRLDGSTPGRLDAWTPRRLDAWTPGRLAVGAVVAVAALALIGWFALRSRSASTALSADIPEQSLAVLPLTNLSGDTSNDYFSDGISEEILSAVSRIPGLRVASRTSSFALRGTALPANEIGRKLKVRHVLDGSVQRSGGQVRVRARLTDASNGYQLWSEKFDKPEGDVFALEDEVADAIASALATALGGAAAPDAAGDTRNAAAYDAYLKGRQALHRRAGPADLAAAIAAFERAVALDSGYARAWASLGSAAVLLPEYGGGTVAHAVAEAERAIGRALALDSSSAEARAALGYLLKSYRYDWAGAEASYRRALALNPNDATTHQWLGELLATVGRLGEADKALDEAVALDPQSAIVHLARGSNELARGDSAAAARDFGQALAIAPGLWSVTLQQLWTAMQRRDSAAADSLAVIVARGFGEDAAPYRDLARAAHDPSRKPAALLLLQLWADQGRTPFLLANWYAALGEPDRALEALDRVVRGREPYASYIPWWPHFAPLRPDPRWQAILRELGVPAVAR